MKDYIHYNNLYEIIQLWSENDDILKKHKTRRDRVGVVGGVGGGGGEGGRERRG